jgi:hypothetical protein
VEWQHHYQKLVMERSPHHIPAIFHMEGLGGAFLQGAVSIPEGINRGSSFDPKLEEELGRSVARQELSVGITESSLCSVISLPEGKTCRVEVSDTWNMTWEVYAENAVGSGEENHFEVRLPGREYMAILITVQ